MRQGLGLKLRAERFGFHGFRISRTGLSTFEARSPIFFPLSPSGAHVDRSEQGQGAQAGGVGAEAEAPRRGQDEEGARDQAAMAAASAARVQSELLSVTSLYNDFAAPFEMWEVGEHEPLHPALAPTPVPLHLCPCPLPLALLDVEGGTAHRPVQNAGLRGPSEGIPGSH